MQKIFLPPTIVGALTQSYIKNGGSKIRLHKTLKYGVFSGPYFPVFGPEKTPYLDTFHAVLATVLTRD